MTKKTKLRIPITIKLIIYFLTLSITSIFIIGKFSYNTAKKALISRTYDQLTSLRIEKEKRVSNFFNQRISDLQNLSNHEDTKELLSKTNIEQANSVFSKYIFGYLQAVNSYKKIIFVDTNSKILSYQLTKNNFIIDTSKIDSSMISEFLNPTHKKSTIVIKESNFENNNQRINIGINVFNNNNKPIGSLILEIEHKRINEIMFENNELNGLGKSGEVYLVGDDYLMRSSSRFHSNSINKTKVKTQGVINAYKGLNKFEKIKDYRNIEVLSSYNKLSIQGLNWVILAEIDYSEAMISIAQVENHIIYLSMIVSLLLLGIIATLSTNITSPIRKLQIATDDILKGNYGKTINLKYKNEIGDLIKAYNNMTLKLKDQAVKIEYEQLIRTTAVINGQEDERQRLSRELHDGLAQNILAIKMKLEYILTTEKNNKMQLLEEAKNLFSETIKEISNISNNLMPSVLKEYGLIKAIENLAATVNKETNFKFIFKYNTICQKFNEKIDVYLYRIIQETFTNTIKHSKATEYFVELKENKNKILLIIQDKGIGFNISNQDTLKGNGLLNIKERVNILSGKIEIKSEKNKGVLIKIMIPI